MIKIKCNFCSNSENDLIIAFGDYISQSQQLNIFLPPFYIFKVYCAKCGHDQEFRLAPKDLIKEHD